ncbi:MAG: amidase [Gammaproteobacteria bacterium]|nr:amidase [Gammaproteobacteria bacterium]
MADYGTRTGFLMTTAPTLAKLSTDLAAGRTSSRSLLEACLARIEDPAGEGRTTFLHFDREAALAQADAMDLLRSSGAAPSPYAGIPISIKDLFDIAGQVTRAGSTVLANRAPASEDAVSVARLRRAGFVLIGRTNMSEFAFSGLGLNPHYGTPRNPWERAAGRIPGGSSSGAAISVVDGMAHAAIGTDTGGSCRIPAAFTGLVGYKPTARRVAQTGAVPLSPSLDSIGPIGHSVDCCAALDALLANETPPDLTDRSLSGQRFAVPRTFVLDDMDRDVAGHFERSLSRISAAGARIEEIDIPELADIPSINAKGGLAAAESFTWHRGLLEAHAAEYDPRVLTRIQRGATQSAVDYLVLLAARRSYIAAVEKRIERFDALLMPTVPIVPPRIADLETDEAFFKVNGLVLRNPAVVNLLDGCAISIPNHDSGEPPTGLMLACRGGLDRQLFRCAAAAEGVVCERR